MTPQEIKYENKKVLVTSIIGKSGKIHPYVAPFAGRFGKFIQESKNGMLLIQFGHSERRSIPASCVTIIGTVPLAGVKCSKRFDRRLVKQYTENTHD